MKLNAVYLMLVSVITLAVAPTVRADCRRVVVHKPFVHHVPVVVEKPAIKAVVAAIEFVTPVLPIYTVPPSYGALYVPPQAYGPPPPAAAQADHGACADVRAELLALKQRLLSLERLPAQAERAAPLRTPPKAEPRGEAQDELERLQLRLEELRKRAAAPKVEPMTKAENSGGQAEGGGFAVWASDRCASCHDRATANLKGGKFALLDGGKVGELTPQQSGEVIRRLSLPDGHADVMPRGKAMPASERLEGIKLFVEGGS